MFNDIPPVQIDEDVIKSFKTQNEFSCLGVELSKELACVATIIVCSRLKEEECFERNDAIIYALAIRLNKLYSSMLENYCNNKAEIVKILERCFFDSYIDLLCLTKETNNEKFDNFVKHSLNQDYTFYKNIEKNIKERGYEKPIEKRMKKSIQNYFKLSNLNMDNYSYKGNSWFCKNVYERFEYCGREKLYDAYRMSSHSVHGGWVDLCMFNLKKVDNGFFINPDFTDVDIRSIAPISLIYIEAITSFIKYMFPIDLVDEIQIRLEDIENRLILLNETHEKFLQISG